MPINWYLRETPLLLLGRSSPIKGELPLILCYRIFTFCCGGWLSNSSSMCIRKPTRSLIGSHLKSPCILVMSFGLPLISLWAHLWIFCTLIFFIVFMAELYECSAFFKKRKKEERSSCLVFGTEFREKKKKKKDIFDIYLVEHLTSRYKVKVLYVCRNKGVMDEGVAIKTIDGEGLSMDLGTHGVGGCAILK